MVCTQSVEGERGYYVAGQKGVVACPDRDLSRCEDAQLLSVSDWLPRQCALHHHDNEINHLKMNQKITKPHPKIAKTLL